MNVVSNYVIAIATLSDWLFAPVVAGRSNYFDRQELGLSTGALII